MKKIHLLLLVPFFFFSCNLDSNTENKAKEDTKVAPIASTEDCKFLLNQENIKMEWTAFKTTERLAVKGGFDHVEYTNINTGTSLSDAMHAVEFSINVSSINSNNKERDGKLIDYFFKMLNMDSGFKGRVESASGDNSNGKVIVLLKINNFSNPVEMSYSVQDNFIILDGDLDLLEWKTNKALSSLNEKCKDLHKGADGVSKTWSEMHINVSIPFQKECK